MPESSLICQYTYTFEEYKLSLDQHRQATSYRQWWLSFAVIALFLGTAVWRTEALIWAGGWSWAFEKNHGYLLREWAPFLVFTTLIGFLLFQGGWLYQRAAKKYTFFNKSMVYTFGTDGFLFESPSVHSTIGWDKITRVRETKSGFVAFLGSYRSYIWWPRDGFQSQEQLDEFRQLIKGKLNP
jgi:hypothetical protein